MCALGFQTDKSTPIGLPEICAPRAKLLDAIDAAAEKRCIYIHAPAGCGKTVSTLLWIRRSGLRTIWLGLDEYDNTPAAFYRFFCNAFFSVIPQEGSLSSIIKDPAFNDSPVEYTMEILSRLSFDDSRYALVLDDFHLITNEEIIKSLVYVLRRLPLSITIVMLSRTGLPAGLAPLEESGRIAYIGAKELAFDSGEIRRLFADYGRFITAEEAREALHLTEGWAIAVGALALSGNIKADHKLKGDLLDQYIRVQIWEKVDEEWRRFMIQTSIVDEFTVPLCEQLTQNMDAKQILDALCAGNMFISNQEGVYRYHHLFLEFLRQEASKEAADGLEDLYRRAADYYLEKGDPFHALRYYIKSGHSRGAANALYYFVKYTGKTSAEYDKISFLNDLPAAVLESNPFLYVGCAWWALLFSDAKKLFYYLDRIYERIADIMGQYGMFLEIMVFLFTVDHRYSFSQQIARLADCGPFEMVHQNVPKLLIHNMPYFHRAYRDFSHYAAETEMHFDEFRQTFFKMLGDDYPIIESGVRGGLLYEKNLLKEAMALVSKNPATDSLPLVFLSHMHIAFCLFAMGREADAARCRGELRTLLEQENQRHLQLVLSAYETRIKLCDGDRGAAEAWLGNYFVTEADSPRLERLYFHFTTARAYIVLGEYPKAQQLCEQVMALCRDFGRLLDGMEAAVLLAVVMWLTGRKQEAAAMLMSTLRDAHPYHFIRVFADEGKAVLPVIKKVVKKAEAEGAEPGFLRYVQEVYLAAYEQAKRHKGIAAAVQKPVELSPRQAYIMELLAKGYKNAEIVALTGLSINTIRSHTKAAYQKLEVGNVMDAVLRARELGLIK